jgi:uroporphyrinogen decarboxylase
MSDPAGFGLLLDKVTAGTIDYLLAQVAAGADAVQLFDSWAGLLPASLFEPLVIAPTQRIVAALKERHPGLPVIGFPRGAGLHLVRYARETRVDGLSLDETVDPLWAAANLPENVVLQGNLDPQYVVAGGTAMTEETQRILEAFSRRAHIFNLGHGLVPETPPGHVAALAALLRGYGA